MESVFSFVIGLLTAALSLLGFVQQHPELPPASRDQANQIAQQAITQATQILAPKSQSVSSDSYMTIQTADTGYARLLLSSIPTSLQNELKSTGKSKYAYLFLSYKQEGNDTCVYNNGVCSVGDGNQLFKDIDAKYVFKNVDQNRRYKIYGYLSYQPSQSEMIGCDPAVKGECAPIYSADHKKFIDQINTAKPMTVETDWFYPTGVSSATQTSTGSLSVSTTNGQAPLTVTFSIQQSAGGQVINFGDGSNPCSPLTPGFTWDEGGCNAPAYPQTFTHTYTSPGVYKVTASRHLPSTTLGTATITVTGSPSNTAAVGTKDFKGAWFKISYPASFVSKAEGADEASFTSPDGSVQFYVYSPQWSGNPVSYLQALPTETVESDTSTPDITSSTNSYGTTYNKKVIRYVTLAAKDGSYRRSFVSTTAGYVTTPDSNDYASKTHTVFGIKYQNQATYDKYLAQYLAFKKSLVQYAD